MEKTNNQLLIDINQIDDASRLVSILELTLSKIDIDTISGMARKEGKTPRGIRTSKCYLKMNVGKQIMVIKGVRDRNKLPF